MICGNVFLAFISTLSFNNYILAQNGNNADLFYKIRKSFYDQGRYLESIDYFDEAIKISPILPATYFDKYDALIILGKNDEAQKAFDRARSLT